MVDALVLSFSNFVSHVTETTSSTKNQQSQYHEVLLYRLGLACINSVKTSQLKTI